ncbi:MAG: hypothetical protein GEV10_16005 [Streptosporangiales bacterium]|nr:hypothetical protein [Streptosporangiales bacterium]
MRQALRDAVHVDRSRLAVNAAARNTVGVVLPLVVGALSGHLVAGVTVAIGAQNVALADRPGPYRLRLARLLFTAAVAAVGAGAGILVGRWDVAAIILTACWAFGAGLLVSLGPTATQVGITSTILMLVLAGRAQFTDAAGPAAAAFTALQILAGGALQALFAVAGWPLRRYRPERLALASAYTELATTATEAPGTDVGPAAGATLDSVHRTIRGIGRNRSATMVAFRVLLDEAERIRIELLALGAHAERLGELGANSSRDRVLDVLTAAATLLRRIGDSLATADPPAHVTLAARELTTAIRSLETLARQSSDSSFAVLVTLRAAVARADALDEQLRIAIGTASTWRYEEDERPGGSAAVHLPASLRFDHPLQTVRANLTPTSSAFRHAVRLAACLTCCDVVVRAADLPRGYWLPLMVLITLQPGFAATLSRGLLRITGTIVGLGVVTGLVAILPDSVWLDFLLVGLLFFGFRALFLASFGLSVAFLTALVVVLLSLIDVDPTSTILERGIYTAAGGAIALGVYLAWPTWERSRVRPRLAELLTAYREYLALVADDEATPAQVASARSAARVARTNAEASLERFSGDPDRTHRDDLVELAESVFAGSLPLVHAAMRLEAARRDAARLPETPALAAFVEHACTALDAMATAVRDGAPLADVPDVPAEADATRADLTDHDDLGATDRTAAALVESTEEIARSLTALAAALRGDRDEDEPAT